jgi:hypothetical protein
MSEAALTMTVPEAGKKYFGLSRNGSYAAADIGRKPSDCSPWIEQSTASD